MKRFLPLLLLLGGCSFLVPGTNIRVGSPLGQVPAFQVIKQGDRYLYSNANLQVSYPATWGNGTDFLPGIGDLHSLVALDIGTSGEASIYFDDAPSITPLEDIYLPGKDGVRSVVHDAVDGVDAVRVTKHKEPRVDPDASPAASFEKPEDQLLVATINNGREFTLKLVTRPPLKGSQSKYEAVFEDMLAAWKWHKATPRPMATPTLAPTGTPAPSVSPTPRPSASPSG